MWRNCKAGLKREFLSLIGVLSHACKVVRAGRYFLRKFIDRSTMAEQFDHYVRLNVSAKADIERWYHFCSVWNGKSMLTSYTQMLSSHLMHQAHGGVGRGQEGSKVDK